MRLVLNLNQERASYSAEKLNFLDMSYHKKELKQNPRKLKQGKHGQSLRALILYDYSWDSAAIIGGSYQTLQPLLSLYTILPKMVKNLFGQKNAIKPLKV